MAESQLTVITPSYRNDYELAVDLCQSMDQFLQVPFKHLLIVPKSDMELFSSLRAPNRILISKEELLRSHGFHKIPFPKRIHIPGLIDIRTREQWYRPGVGRVTGWLVQQLVKLSAPELADSDYFMFIDSDNVLFRPMKMEDLTAGASIKLARRPLTPEMHEHLLWHRNALSVLGVEQFSDTKYNYIGHFIVWKRDAILALQRQIEKISGEDWRITLCKKKAVSEYILYGVFCETVGWDAHYHVLVEPELTCSYWTSSEEDLNVQEMAKSLKPTHVALHIQSTIPMPMAKRRTLINALAASAPPKPLA
jgi:hypothetical protein